MATMNAVEEYPVHLERKSVIIIQLICNLVNIVANICEYRKRKEKCGIVRAVNESITVDATWIKLKIKLLGIDIECQIQSLMRCYCGIHSKKEPFHAINSKHLLSR